MDDVPGVSLVDLAQHCFAAGRLDCMPGTLRTFQVVEISHGDIRAFPGERDGSRLPDA
jgi:hypothetical protein